MNPISKSNQNPQKPVNNVKEKAPAKADKRTAAAPAQTKSSNASELNLSDKKAPAGATTYCPQEMKAKAKFFLDSDIPNAEERAVLEEIVATDLEEM